MKIPPGYFDDFQTLPNYLITSPTEFCFGNKSISNSLLHLRFLFCVCAFICLRKGPEPDTLVMVSLTKRATQIQPQCWRHCRLTCWLHVKPCAGRVALLCICRHSPEVDMWALKSLNFYYNFLKTQCILKPT